MDNKEHIELAEKFLLKCLEGGLARSYDVKKKYWVKPYPEATGYLLSYFSQYWLNIPSVVLNAANYLLRIQHPTGGFPTFFQRRLFQLFNKPRYLYTFDTAQIMHGFLSLYKKTNEKIFFEVARKCAEFVINMQTENGSMFPIFDLKLRKKYVNENGSWGSNFSPIQVKNIEGLLLMYELTNESKYKTAAIKLRDYGLKHCDLTFTHPGAYCLEGLIAIGEKEFVYNKLKEEIVPRIQPNGFLSYSKTLPYAYVSGSVQMAILLFKIGLKKTARLILEWARKVQLNHNSGGLFQYANPDGSLNCDVHREINSWGTKYYAELERLFNEN
jgi:hypothetical protein